MLFAGCCGWMGAITLHWAQVQLSSVPHKTNEPRCGLFFLFFLGDIGVTFWQLVCCLALETVDNSRMAIICCFRMKLELLIFSFRSWRSLSRTESQKFSEHNQRCWMTAVSLIWIRKTKITCFFTLTVLCMSFVSINDYLIYQGLFLNSLHFSVYVCVSMMCGVCSINVCTFVCNEKCMHGSNSLLSSIPSSSSSSAAASTTSGMFTYPFVTQRLCGRYSYKLSVWVCEYVGVCVHRTCPPSTALSSPYRSSQWSCCRREWGLGASALMTEIKAEGRDKEDGLHADPWQEAAIVFNRQHCCLMVGQCRCLASVLSAVEAVTALLEGMSSII